MPSKSLNKPSKTIGREGIALRTRLRLLTTTRMMNTHLKSRLKSEFGLSLARFDVMAQLAKSSKPLTMSDVSNLLMGTGGNMTSLTDGMERDGLVARLRSATDRRVIGVELTQKGAALFEQAASENTTWVNELFTDMSLEQLILLRELIGDLKNSASRAGMDERIGTNSIKR